MRKLFFIFCLFPFFVNASCLLPELKVSYYRFNSSLLRDIYGGGAPLIQGEINYNPCKYLLVFADVGYLWKNGRSINFHQRTRIEIFPWTLGAKCFYPFRYGSVYAGGGFRTSTLSVHNKSCYVQRNVHKTELGGVINAGANLCWKRFVFNPFVEYNFNRMSFHRNQEDIERNIYRHDLQIGGWAFGGGLGYAF